MFVKFHTDGSVVKKGFFASFRKEALVSVCKKDWFDCKSAGCYNPWCDGTCLPLRRVNNGMNDCADGSDEGILVTCEEPSVCCAGDLQECPGMCIPEKMVQDASPDCYGNEWDELNPRDEIGCKDNNNRGPNLLDLVLIPGSTSKKRSACWHIDVDQGVWDQASRDYAGAFCSNWYGWSDGDTNGAIRTMFYSRTPDGGWIDGCARLDFGNCYSSGTVQVSLTGVEIASTLSVIFFLFILWESLVRHRPAISRGHLRTSLEIMHSFPPINHRYTSIPVVTY